MAATSTMLPLGTQAPDFALPDLGGDIVSLESITPSPALLVAFLCNHCPYVRHVEHTLGTMAAGWQQRGVAVVGICSNDAEQYPDDDRDGLAAQAARAGFTFPYLVDESQEVGRGYRAACTPDFFLFDRNQQLAYRGAFDASTPGNDEPVTGAELDEAVSLVLAGRDVPEPHRPSMGCSIKWKR